MKHLNVKTLSLLACASLVGTLCFLGCAQPAATGCQAAKNATNCSTPGAKCPQCDATDSSKWQAKQCWGSTGGCWCVDPVTGTPTNTQDCL